MHKGPYRFLRIVGAGYIVLGVAGLVALYSRVPNLLPLVGLVSLFAMVTPHSLTVTNGIQASCDGQPRGAWGCNLDVGVIAQARDTLGLLCLAAIVGGVLGFWAASPNNRRGRVIWVALAAISLLVTAANLIVGDGLPANPVMVVPSIWWSIAYSWAAALLFRRGHIPTDPGV